MLREMNSETVYLSLDQLQEQGLPPLTLCGGPLAPYGPASAPSASPPTSNEPAQPPAVGVRSGPAVVRGAPGSEAEGVA